MLPILSFLIFTPIIGSFFLFLSPHEKSFHNGRFLALWVSGFVFALSFLLGILFYINGISEYCENFHFLPFFDCSYDLRVDGVSLPFVLLTSFLFFISFLFYREADRLKGYYASFFFLETFLFLLFCTCNALILYISFESIFFLFFYINGIWGRGEHIQSGFRFLVWNSLGSLLILLSLLKMFNQTGSLDLRVLSFARLPWEQKEIFSLFLLFGFLIKIPLWPFHSWFPKLVSESSPSGSFIFSGILSKIGGYGILRLLYLSGAKAHDFCRPVLLILGVFSLLYFSLMACRQKDIRKVIAYFSMASMATVAIGLGLGTLLSVSGAVFHMVTFGLISAIFLFISDILYSRFNTYSIEGYGAIKQEISSLNFPFLFLTLCAIGLPGGGGFIGNLLIVFSSFPRNTLVAFIVSLNSFLGSLYMINLYQKVFGNTALGGGKKKDLVWLEKIILRIFCFILLFLGLYPSGMLNSIHKALQKGFL